MICNKVKTKSEKIPLVGIVEIDSIIYDYLDSILYFSKYKDLYDKCMKCYDFLYQNRLII